MAQQLANGKQQFIDGNGNPLAGGSVAFYLPGTLTPTNTWQDPGLTILNANPVILDANGMASIWGIGSTQYRQIVENSVGVTIWDQVVGLVDSYQLSSTGSVVRTVPSKLQESISVLDFGADPTGVADSTSAFNSCFAATTNPVIPPGNYIFNEQLNYNSTSKLSIKGAGSSVTRLIYNGANTTNDCFVFGTTTGGAPQLEISGVRFLSNTKMTAGAGVHYYGLDRATLRDVQYSSQDENNYNFYHGAWVTGCDFSYFDGFQALAQQDGIRCSGSTTLGQADIYLQEGKVFGCTNGLHFSGGMGGITVDNSDIIKNLTNILVDQADLAVTNREVFLGSGLAIDSAGTSSTANGIGVDIQDTDALVIFNETWVSSAGILIRTGANYTGPLLLKTPFLFNADTNSGTTHGNAVEIGNVNCAVVAQAPILRSIQGIGFTCTAGVNAQVVVNNPVAMNQMEVFDPATICPTFIDNSSGFGVQTSAVSLAANATYNFNNFSGQINVQNNTTGSIGSVICGGGGVLVLGWTGTVGGTFAYNSAIAGYTFTNTGTSTAIFTFIPIRQRAAA